MPKGGLEPKPSAKAGLARSGSADSVCQRVYFGSQFHGMLIPSFAASNAQNHEHESLHYDGVHFDDGSFLTYP